MITDDLSKDAKYVRVNEEKLAAACFDPQLRETRKVQSGFKKVLPNGVASL